MNLIHYVFSIIILIGLGSCSSEQCRQVSIDAEFPSLRLKQNHLPTKCRSLLSKPDPSKWNPSTETYTIQSDAWIDCMGVGKRSDM